MINNYSRKFIKDPTAQETKDHRSFNWPRDQVPATNELCDGKPD